MNWDEVGAIGQMLGSVAVFVTLGYLAVQVRHARAESAAIRQPKPRRSRRELSITMQATNEWLAPRKGQRGARADSTVRSSRTDGARLDSRRRGDSTLLGAVWRAGLSAQIITYIGRTDRRGSELSSTAIRHTTASTGVTPLVRRDKATLNPDAVRYIDNLLAQPA